VLVTGTIPAHLEVTGVELKEALVAKQTKILEPSKFSLITHCTGFTLKCHCVTFSTPSVTDPTSLFAGHQHTWVSKQKQHTQVKYVSCLLKLP
jgi:hypothetical protein